MSNITETVVIDELDIYSNDADDEGGPLEKAVGLAWLLLIAWCLYMSYLKEQARIASDERERIEQAAMKERERKLLPKTREKVIAKTIMKKVRNMTVRNEQWSIWS